ncbi:L-alanine-DL-glutamate epimerase-like enolase superfamily enzyme [Deinobacterium chartae]|uniref:Dipeptide epimerase n=1 Tax=Deinobacterium chartae TaxID=521158 RepID=A0A841HXU9_9DEIO|nr:dipeptide epimerase [Deinobacterium chartae]MBB6096748.1 L-alanine-DL-glutamate epimerase-like enolase superfamily enzyme [Deinobacterium chartae]
MTVSWNTRVLHTKSPFGIARWTHSEYPRTFVHFEHGGVTGRGEAAPNAFYGENRATVEAALPPLSAHLHDPWDWEALEAALSRTFPHGHPSVKCALEMAALEACALEAGLPVWKLLGLSSKAVPESSYTISIAELPEMERQAREATAQGYRILKVKLGTDRDVPILETLRAAAPQATLRVDANAAWTRSQAKRMLAVLEACGVELLEQPLPAADLEGHAELRRVSPLPLVADESLHDRSTVPALARAFDAVNLKIAKLGGPLQALHTARTARALGMNVMIGCMIESSLGISASVHLAGLADWVDLDGALLLADDPYEGLEWQGGQVTRPTQAGWGVRERA